MKTIHYKKPTKQELKDDLNRLLKRKEKIDEGFDRLEDIFSGVIGGPFYDSVYYMVEDYSAYIAAVHDIDEEDLSWFIYELDCGNRPEVVSIGDKAFAVNSVDTFVDYITSI
jgi:hypothetical protein